MVDFHDPVILLEDYLSVTKLSHAVAGFYFWEFVTTLDYEWNVILGYRPYRWPIWFYCISRIATAISLAFVLYGIDDTSQYNCEVNTVLQLSFGYLSIATSLFLIMLRIIAIWNENKMIVGISTGILGVNVVLLIQGIVRIRVVRDPLLTASVCVVVNRHIPEFNVFCTLATDIILLLIMSFGLFRLGFHERSATGLGHFLWKQGLIWLLIATIVEVLPAVFISLNLNDSFNYMFLPPSMITISIAATRIYRLADHPPVGPVRFRRNGQYDITTPIPFFSALNVVYIAGLATPSASKEVIA
ncbi:hypothetical protein BGY98DRAFT_1094143 [Russula aff. rugulosa BPL654]|nr:hypothetical protein BGY98DRAFT_1094143 [Russula aff. rugulosa BPL654]